MRGFDPWSPNARVFWGLRAVTFLVIVLVLVVVLDSFFQRLWSPTIRSLDQKRSLRPNRISKSRTRTIATTLNTPIYAILQHANSCFPRFRLLFDRRPEASSRRFARTRWDIIHFTCNHNFFFSRPRKWADPAITARFFGDGQSCRCDQY
jgi:hypothetical protein